MEQDMHWRVSRVPLRIRLNFFFSVHRVQDKKRKTANHVSCISYVYYIYTCVTRNKYRYINCIQYNFGFMYAQLHVYMYNKLCPVIFTLYIYFCQQDLRYICAWYNAATLLATRKIYVAFDAIYEVTMRTYTYTHVYT